MINTNEQGRVGVKQAQIFDPESLKFKSYLT